MKGDFTEARPDKLCGFGVSKSMVSGVRTILRGRCADGRGDAATGQGK